LPARFNAALANAANLPRIFLRTSSSGAPARLAHRRPVRQFAPMQRRRLLAFAAALASPTLASPALAFPALVGTAAAQAVPLRVVASFSILADMVREIGGDQVTVASLAASPRQIPGDPATLTALRHAGLVVENGLGLEPWLPALLRAAGWHGPRVAASSQVTPHTRHVGGRTVPDPHAWHDPRNGVRYVQAIASGLSAARPESARLFRARADTYAGRIAGIDVALGGLFAGLPAAARRVLTCHDQFRYFAARYAIAMPAILSPAPASGAPTPTGPTLAALALLARQNGTRAVFLDESGDDQAAGTVARLAGLPIGGRLQGDALSAADGPAATYMDLLRANAGTLAAAMRG
jgi:zinc/manganese transport system substrate-binding protein